MAEGRKDDQEKLRYDLIPVGPLAEIAKVYTIGAKKYADRNWELGIKWGRVYAALLRHVTAWWKGEQLDPKDGQHHLASVAWCALALMEYEQTHRELDDRPQPPPIYIPSVWKPVPLNSDGTVPSVPYNTQPEMPDNTQVVQGRERCPRCGLWFNKGQLHICL